MNQQIEEPLRLLFLSNKHYASAVPDLCPVLSSFAIVLKVIDVELGVKLLPTKITLHKVYWTPTDNAVRASLI